jgi:hypothetical protein
MASSDKNGIRLADLGLAGIAAVFVGHSARREMRGGKTPHDSSTCRSGIPQDDVVGEPFVGRRAPEYWRDFWLAVDSRGPHTVRLGAEAGSVARGDLRRRYQEFCADPLRRCEQKPIGAPRWPSRPSSGTSSPPCWPSG